MREKGYLHARSDAALALLRLGQCLHACQLANAGLALLGTPTIEIRLTGRAYRPAPQRTDQSRGQNRDPRS